MKRPTKEWLQAEYWDKGKSLSRIGEECGVKAPTILYWMKCEDIPRRTKKAAWAFREPVSEEARAELSKKLSAKCKQRWDDGIYSTPEIKAKKSIASKAAHERGSFDRVYTKERAGKISASLLRHWDKCGRVPRRYQYTKEWSEAFRAGIRDWDNHTCQICLRPGDNVHHIDYDQKNTTAENCITLCRSCHTKTNAGRPYWRLALMGLMEDCNESRI